MTDLSVKIEEYISERLAKYTPTRVTHSKAIHDTLWGTSIFTPGEIAVIDTPLVQRLRGIHQTALAFLTYPSATHTRFEHSLGVAIVATKIVDSLNRRASPEITLNEKKEIRLAALLHDVGHGILSHISENNFKRTKVIKDFKASDKKFSGAKPHEIMSYLIVRSESFKNFFQRHISPHYNELYSVDLAKIAGYIIGHAEPGKKYLADIINSAFDADKLDYIARDSYFAGLSLNVDIERLLYSMAVLKKTDGVRCLAIKASGVQALEQVMFSKMILYCSLYHHQKVRAADSMLNTYVEYVKENYGSISGSPRLLEPWQFIQYIDADVLCPNGHSNDFLKRIAERISERRIYKRALIISPKTISKGLLYKITRLKEASDKEEKLKAYARKIYEAIPPDDRGQMTHHEIIIDIPDDPSLRESQQCPVIDKLSDDTTKYQALNKYFPVDDWLTAYYANKWIAHVFCPPEMQKSVNIAARIFFYEELGLIFSERATTFARIEHSPIQYNGKKGNNVQI